VETQNNSPNEEKVGEVVEKTEYEKFIDKLLESKWSYSKIDCFKSCGFKFKLKYLDKNFVYSGSIATEFGTAIHKAEESIGNYIIKNEPINYIKIKNKFMIDCIKVKKRYPNDWITKDDYSGKDYETKYQDYIHKNMFYLEKYLKDNPNLEIVGSEVPINFKFDDTWTFTGSIDRLYRDKTTDKYIIEDIKSWPNIEKHKDELATPLQFVVYSLALAKMKEKSTDDISCQYYLPISNELASAGHKNYIEKGTAKLMSLFEKILAQEFKPAPKPLCHWCEFCRTNESAPNKSKWLCPYASVWTRERPANWSEFNFTTLEEYPKILNQYRLQHDLPVLPSESENKK